MKAPKKRRRGTANGSACLTEKELAEHQRRFLKMTKKELCWDLAGKFARKSAEDSDQIANLRLRYAAIAQEFRSHGFSKPLTAAKKKKLVSDLLRAGGDDSGEPREEKAREKYYRELAEVSKKQVMPVLAHYFAATQGETTNPSLSERLAPHYQTDRDAKRVIDEIESCVIEQLSCLGKTSAPRLYEQHLKNSVIRVLAHEWLRDRTTLKAFLLAMLQRFRNIDDPRGVWRRRMVIDQMSTVFGHQRNEHLEHLERIGVVLKPQKEWESRALLNMIGQDLSRDLRDSTQRRKRSR